MSISKKIERLENPDIYNVGVYIRTGGKIEGLDITKYQRDRVDEYCQQLKVKIVDYYIDDGVPRTGIKLELKRLLQDIENGKINMIVTANIERISGTQKEMIELAKLERDSGVRILMADSREEIKNYRFIDSYEKTMKMCRGEFEEEDDMEM